MRHSYRVVSFKRDVASINNNANGEALLTSEKKLLDTKLGAGNRISVLESQKNCTLGAKLQYNFIKYIIG